MEKTPESEFDPQKTNKENFPKIIKPNIKDYKIKGCKIDFTDKEQKIALKTITDEYANWQSIEIHQACILIVTFLEEMLKLGKVYD